MGWDRRDMARWCVAAWLATSLPAAQAQRRPPLPVPVAPPGSPRIVLAVAHKAAFCQLPLTLAERLGFFAQERVDVQIREFPDATAALQAVLSGTAQVFSGPFVSTLLPQARGLRSIVLQSRAPQLVLGVSSQTMGHFRQLRDLRGKRVGVMGLGTGSHRITRLLLARAGIAAPEVHYIPLAANAAALGALRAGQVDAICYDDPTITMLEQGGDLRVVADTRTLRGCTDVFGGPMPSAMLGVLPHWVNEQPDGCQALVSALVHALKWLQTAGPSDLIQAVPEAYFQGDRALYLAAFSRAREAWSPDGLMPETGPPVAARTLVQLDDVPMLRSAELVGTFTNDFARKAKVRFRA